MLDEKVLGFTPPVRVNKIPIDDCKGVEYFTRLIPLMFIKAPVEET